MSLSKWATTVTPLSKILALIIFITFPIIGFVLGMEYQKVIYKPKIEYIPSEKVVKISQADTERSLLKRCGEFPEKAYPRKQDFDSITGPFWSSNCRYIIWSQRASFRGYEGSDSQEQTVVNNLDTIKIPDRAGVFFYRDGTEKIIKIFTPKKIKDNFSIDSWNTANSFIYIVNGKNYIYDILKERFSEK